MVYTMSSSRSPLRRILDHPGRFAIDVLRGFRSNQGLLLSGALAYYTLLSIVPLFTLLLVVLSHILDEQLLLNDVARYLALVVPADTADVMGQIRNFLANREIAGWVVFGALLFFSSMAFTVLENAMSVIFAQRLAIRRRHFLISAVLPYAYIVLLGLGLLLTSVVAGALQTLAVQQVDLFGTVWSLDQLSVVLLYLIGLGGEILMLTSIYMVTPVGRPSLRHALIGGVVAALLWDITRRILVWYFATLSLVNVIYGSLATVVVALLSLEMASVILLLGAQVIAEYERVARAR